MDTASNFTDEAVLYGTHAQQFIREFVTHSGIFWLFDAVTNIGSDGLFTYLSYLPQWAMLLAALVQTWVISRNEFRFRWWYVFIAPLFYSTLSIW